MSDIIPNPSTKEPCCHLCNCADEECLVFCPKLGMYFCTGHSENIKHSHIVWVIKRFKAFPISKDKNGPVIACSRCKSVTNPFDLGVLNNDIICKDCLFIIAKENNNKKSKLTLENIFKSYESLIVHDTLCTTLFRQAPPPTEKFDEIFSMSELQ